MENARVGRKIIINHRAEQLLIIIYAMSAVEFLRRKIMIAILRPRIRFVCSLRVFLRNQSSILCNGPTRCGHFFYYFQWRSRCLRAFLPDAVFGNKYLSLSRSLSLYANISSTSEPTELDGRAWWKMTKIARVQKRFYPLLFVSYNKRY